MAACPSYGTTTMTTSAPATAVALTWPATSQSGSAARTVAGGLLGALGPAGADPHRQTGLRQPQREAAPLGPRAPDQANGQLFSRHARRPSVHGSQAVPAGWRIQGRPVHPCRVRHALRFRSAAGYRTHAGHGRRGASWLHRRRAPPRPRRRPRPRCISPASAWTTTTCAPWRRSTSACGRGSSSSSWGPAAAARHRCCGSRRDCCRPAGASCASWAAPRARRRPASGWASSRRRRRCSPGATCGRTSRCPTPSTARRTAAAPGPIPRR